MSAPTLHGKPVAAVDFEASCMPGRGSYPVEVAVAIPGVPTRAWLISPTSDWLSEGRWDTRSEALHGISLEVLSREGLPPSEVCRSLLEAVGDRSLVSDHGHSDGAWMEALWRGAGLPGASAPLVADLSEEFDHPAMLALVAAGMDWQDAMDDMEATREEAGSGKTPAHRAGPDAEATLRLVLLLARKASETGRRPG